MSNKNFKCGNCGTVVKPKFFSTHNDEFRYNCKTCGPLCRDCYSSSFFSMGKCKGCGEEAKAERFIRGEWR